MLPHDYQLPAAVVLVLAGTIACFAGYRLLRIVLALYGFVLGAMIASSFMGTTNTAGLVIAGAAGGLIGALVLVFAYFIGIALMGAGLGALVAYVFASNWAPAAASGSSGAPTDPSTLLLIASSIVGAVAAMVLQRYVIVVSTAFGGAWTLLVGAVAAFANRDPRIPPSDVWILYPFSLSPGRRWVVTAWVAIGLVGTVAQLWVTARKRR